MFRFLSICMLLSLFLATPALAADSDEGFISKSWHSITSYFTDEKDKERQDDDGLPHEEEDDASDDLPVAPTPTPVADTVAPSIQIQQAGITIEATALQMSVNLGVVTANDLVDGAITPTNNAPATFSLGVTTVIWTATDAAGNTSTATQNVVVQDTTAPVITAPAAVVVNSTTGQPIAVTIGATTATDAFTPVSITNNGPATFPIGATTVTWTATDANNNSATATQLVTVNDTSIFATLPPDPGAAGKLTLAGIDSDNDGVRDDVQRWIVMTYPNSQKTRAALTQDAKAMQLIILNAANAAVARANSIEEDRATFCITFVRRQILGIGNSDAYQIGREMEAICLNTTARTEAWLQADRYLSGMMFNIPGDLSTGCNFNPNTMPN